MAAASYTTDLAVHDDATNAGNFSEPTGFTDLDGNGVDDTDLAIFGTQCVSESMRKTGLGALVSGPAARTLPTNGAFFAWFKWFAPNSLDTKANGGMQFLIGNTTANFRQYYIDGSDTYDVGGWKNYAVDPTVTASATTGTPNTTYQQAGIGVSCPVSTPQKGNSYTIDIIRYGRGELIITDGDLANGYANFDDAATTNDNPTTGRWGLFSNVGGSYLWKGLLSLGTTATAVDFRDSNKTITIDNTEYVSAPFNRIEVNNAGSNIEWNSVTISSLSTVSRGQFAAIDNATISLDACTFTDMGTFSFLSNSTVTDSTFRRCQQVTQGGSTITGTLFTNTVDNVALSADNIGLVTECNFIGDGTSHAVNLGTISTTASVSWNNTYDPTTYATTSVTNNATSTPGDSEVVLVNVASGQTLTINVTGGTAPTYRNTGPGTVNVVASVTYTVTNLIEGSEVRFVNTTTGTILAGVESVSASPTGVDGVVVTADPAASGRFRAAYSYNQTDAPINVRIVVMNLQYEHFSQNVVLGTDDSSLLVSQRFDRNYSNP